MEGDKTAKRQRIVGRKGREPQETSPTRENSEEEEEVEKRSNTSYLCYWSGGGRRAQEGENRNCREKGFEGDEQCEDAERMNVTVG